MMPPLDEVWIYMAIALVMLGFAIRLLRTYARYWRAKYGKAKSGAPSDRRHPYRYQPENVTLSIDGKVVGDVASINYHAPKTMGDTDDHETIPKKDINRAVLLAIRRDLESQSLQIQLLQQKVDTLADLVANRIPNRFNDAGMGG